jgi:hypothetical protein
LLGLVEGWGLAEEGAFLFLFLFFYFILFIITFSSAPRECFLLSGAIFGFVRSDSVLEDVASCGHRPTEFTLLIRDSWDREFVMALWS